MGTWRSVELHDYLVVGFQLVFFAAICSCKHDSSLSSRVDGWNSKFCSNDPNFKLLPRTEKYILKSILEKHNSWSELDLRDFVRHEVSLASCELVSENLSLLRLSVPKRYLVGEGSHRRLFSSFRINTRAESIHDLPAHSCEILIIERLPLGVFADPFELEHLLQRGVFKDAAVFGDRDLELPTILSNRSLVEIHMDVGVNALTSWKGVNIDTELPLHTRYPPLEGSGYVSVEFGPPDVFLRCSLVIESQNQNCLSILKGASPESKSNAAVWRIPSGMKVHAGVVSLVTFSSALLSAVLIIATSICYSDVKMHKNSKQS